MRIVYSGFLQLVFFVCINSIQLYNKNITYYMYIKYTILKDYIIQINKKND
jgi:poly-beta-hydroxyalkanoate depolymerase